MRTPARINSPCQAAQSSGAPPAASVQALTIADIGAMIRARLGTPTDFRRVSREMGTAAQWGLTPGNDVSQMRRAFRVLSPSAGRASQSAAPLGQAVLGGFGAPYPPSSLWR